MKITEKQYLDALRALYQKYFKDRKDYLDEYQKYEKEYLDGMKDLYQSVMSGIISRIDDHIDKLNDQKDAAIDSLEKQKDAAEKSYEAQRDAAIKAIEEEQEAREKALQAEWDARKEVLENEKQALQDQMDILQDQIDARNKEIQEIQDAADKTKRQYDLEKALYDQRRVQEQKVNKVYSGQGRGYIYEADTSSIREADQAVEDAQRNIRIANIQEEVDALEERRDALADQQDQIEEQIDALDDYYNKLIDESNEYYDKLIDNTNAYYDELIDGSNAYYDSLIESTEASWNKIIESFELTKSKWEELQDLEEQAEFEANLRQLGLTLDEVLNMSESDFEAFKNSYLNIMADIYSGNDQMIASMSELANVDMSALPGYLAETQQYIDMLNEGIDFSNLNDSLSSTVTGIEDAAKAAGILTGAILGGTSEEGGEGSGNSGGAGVVPGLIQAGEVGAEQAAVISDSFAGEEESAAAAINTTTQGITGGGSSDEGKGKDSKSGKSDKSGDSEGADGLIPAFTETGEVGAEQAEILAEAYGGDEGSVASGVNTATQSVAGGGDNAIFTEGEAGSFIEANTLATEAALDEEKGLPAQISMWEELNEVLGNVISSLDEIRTKLENLSTIEVTIPGISGGYSHFEGTVGNSYSSGTSGVHGIPSREHNALVSEFGPEIAVYPNGTYKLFKEPSIVDLPQGTAIFNTKQTLDILKGKKHISLGSSHFEGYSPETLEHMRNLLSDHTLDNFNLGTLGDYEVAGSNNSNTVVNLNGGITLEGVQDVDALAKGIVQKLPLRMMQIMNKKEYRPRK